MIDVKLITRLNRAKQLIEKLKNPAKASRRYADYCTQTFFNRIIAGKDPYGNNHKPLTPKYKRWKLKRTKNPILMLSGKTIKKYRAIPSKFGVTEIIDSKIAAYHQYGTKRLPVRLYLPTGAKGLPNKQGIKLFSILKLFFEEY